VNGSGLKRKMERLRVSNTEGGNSGSSSAGSVSPTKKMRRLGAKN
jgi:hypothetical protein